MRCLYPIFLLVPLSACTTLTATQDRCFDGFKTFPDQAACIRQSVAGNTALRNQSLVQEYVLTADHLAALVKSGKMTEADARLHLTEKLNNVRERDIAEQADLADIYSGHGPNSPAYTDCVRSPGQPACLSF